jgi:hypothetical protein
MLKKMREGGAYFIKGVMVLVVVTFVGPSWCGVNPRRSARRGVVATVADRDLG